METGKIQVAKTLAALLSDVVTARFILQGYHWNVMGPDFGEFHEFFGELYEDVESSVDPLAENILKAGFPAPYLLADFLEMSCIKEDRLDGSSSQFLLQSTLRVMDALYEGHLKAFHEAAACDMQGLMDFLATRIDIYAKHQWQVKAFLGVR